MSQFKDVGHAMLIRDGLIKKLDTNRTILRQTRNCQDSPAKAGSLAAAEARHEKDCDAFAEAHGFVVAMVERLADADGHSLANYVERLIEAAEEAAQKAKKP